MKLFPKSFVITDYKNVHNQFVRKYTMAVEYKIAPTKVWALKFFWDEDNKTFTYHGIEFANASSKYAIKFLKGMGEGEIWEWHLYHHLWSLNYIPSVYTHNGFQRDRNFTRINYWANPSPTLKEIIQDEIKRKAS